MNAPFLAACLAAAALLAGSAQAQTYRWVDEQGRVRYTDTPPPASAKGSRQIQSGAGAAPAAEPRSAPAERTGAQAGKLPEVMLYTNSGCGQLCADARAYLGGRGVKFREVEVESAESLEELRKLAGSMSVPALRIGETVQRGYDEMRYARMLDSAGFPKSEPGRAAAPAPAARPGPYGTGALPQSK